MLHSPVVFILFKKMSLKTMFMEMLHSVGRIILGASMMLVFKSAWFSQQNDSEKITKKFLASDMNSGNGEWEEQER